MTCDVLFVYWSDWKISLSGSTSRTNRIARPTTPGSLPIQRPTLRILESSNQINRSKIEKERGEREEWGGEILTRVSLLNPDIRAELKIVPRGERDRCERERRRRIVTDSESKTKEATQENSGGFLWVDSDDSRPSSPKPLASRAVR